jgi:hypothetical protein
MAYRTGLAAALRQGMLDLAAGEDTTPHVGQAARPILLIQGFASSSRTMLPLERRLRRSLLAVRSMPSPAPCLPNRSAPPPFRRCEPSGLLGLASDDLTGLRNRLCCKTR